MCRMKSVEMSRNHDYTARNLLYYFDHQKYYKLAGIDLSKFIIILARGDIITTSHNNPTLVTFRNWAPFINCIRKNDGTIMDDAKDLVLVMPMYKLIEYSSDFSDTTGSLRFYSNDKATKFNADIANINVFTSFKYKAKL